MAYEHKITNQFNINIDGRLEMELERAQNTIDSLEDQLNQAYSKMDQLVEKTRELSSELESVKSGKGINILEEELERFRDTAERSLTEFRSFLQSVNLNDALGSNDWQFDELFKEIEEGSITAGQAITRVKTEFRSLIEENFDAAGGLFDAQMVQSFTASLEQVVVTLDDLVNRVHSIEQGGFSAGGGGGAVGISVNVIEQIRAALEGMSEGAQAAAAPIANLVEKITSFANVDSTNLLSVEHAFRGIADIGKGGYGTKSIENLKSLISSIAANSGGGSLRLSVDLKGFENLQVRKTSLANLAEYLPKLQEVDAGKIEALSRINLTNFNDIHINKTAIEGIESYINKLNELAEKLNQLNGTATPSGHGVDNRSGLSSEKTEVKELNDAWEDHDTVVKDAVEAEQQKTKQSNELSDSLNTEAKKMDDASQSAKSHAEVLHEVSDELSNMRTVEAQITDGGIDKIIESLSSSGVEESVAKEIGQSFANLKGEINKVKIEWRDMADTGEQVTRVTVSGIDEAGNAIRETVDYIREVNEAGEETWRIVKSGSATFDAAKQGATEFENAKNKIKEYFDAVKKLKGTDIVFEEGKGWYSKSGSDIFADRVARLNELQSAYEALRTVIMAEDATEAASNLSSEQRKALIELLTKKETEYGDAIDERRFKEERANRSRNDSNKQQTEDLNKLEDELDKARKAREGFLKDGDSAFSPRVRNIDLYIDKLIELNNKVKTGSITHKEFQDKLREINEEYGRMSGRTSLFGNLLDATSKKLADVLSATRIVMAIYRELKKMVKTSIEIDTAMNQMQIVTRESDVVMKEFGDTAAATAKQIGASMTDVISSATTFARLGYNLDDSSLLSKYTTMLQNVGDIDTSSAQDAVTAIIKAFDIDIGQIESVMDKLVTVGNNFPISVKQIAEGMNNASSVLSATGNTFEESVALLTAANTTIQNAAKASTGLRTMTARITKTKTELDELGEEMTDAQYEDLVAALTDANVKLRDQNDEFRSTYQIFSDIASVWDTLTNTQKTALAQTIGSTRNQAIFYSVVENFKEAKGAMEAMGESAGALETAYSTRMESITAHTEQFKAAFQELSKDFIDSDFAKQTIDTGTKLIEILDGIAKALDKIGGLKTVITMLTGSLITRNAGSLFWSDKLNTETGKVERTYGVLLKRIKDFQTGFASAGKESASFFKKIKSGASSALGDLSGLQKGILAVTAVMTVVSVINGLIENARAERRSNLDKAFESGISKAEETKNLSEVYESYLKAKSAVDNNIESKKALEEATLSLAKALGLEGEAAKKTGDELETLTTKELDDARHEAEAAVVAAKQRLLGNIDAPISFSDIGKNSTRNYIQSRLGIDYIRGISVDKQWNSYSLDEKAAKLTDLYETLVAERNELLDKGEEESKQYTRLDNAINYLKGDIKDLNIAQDALTGATERYNNAANGYVKTEETLTTAAKTRKQIAESILGITVEDGTTQRRMIVDMISLLEHIPDDDLAIAEKLLSRGEYDNWEKLTEAIKAYKNSFEPLADTAKESLSDIWESDDFSDTRKEIDKMAKSVNGITADNVIELCGESEALGKILATDGMSAQFLAHVLQQEVNTGNGFELITGAALELNGALMGITARFDEVIAAKARYDAAVSGGEKDDNFKSMADAWAKLDEEFVNGNLNSNQFWASAEYLFGADKLDEWGWADGIDKIHDALVGTSVVFGDAESSGDGFLKKMEEIASEGKIIGEDGSIIAEISDDSWSIDNKSVDEFAEKMGMSKEAVLSCIQALDKLGVVNFYDSEEVMNVLKDLKLASDGMESTAVNAGLFVAQLEALGYSKSTIHSIMKDLQETEGVTFISTTQSVEDLTASLVNLGVASSENGKITIDITNLSELLANMNFTKEQAAEIVEKLGEVDSVTLTNAEGQVINVKDAMDELDKHDFAEVVDGVGNITDGAGDATDAVKDTCTYMEKLETRVNRLNGKIITITVNVKTNDPSGVLNTEAAASAGIRPNQGGMVREAYAEGTKDARGGPSVVGEEDEELVLHRGGAYLAGKNGPEILDLDKGDTVYTAEETAAILRKRHSIRGTIPAYASGKRGNYSYTSANPGATGSSSGSSSSSSSSGGYSSTSSNSVSKEVEQSESEFERLYKYHKHLIEMDAEETADFLEWLNDAYKEAYRNNEIELDDFYQYEEEVYNGMKELFQDYVSDVEHEIDMRSAFEGENKTILLLYKRLISDVEKEIAAARSRGLDNNDDYIQDLQKKWSSYVDAVKELQDDATDNAKDAVDELVEIRIDMLKQDIKNEKDAIKTRLDMLKDFYQKQKDMLQDEYDEDKYLEEQKEKRKKIADIQQKLNQLQFDDSAWAQKRRLELTEELTDAQKELDDFEKEHALKSAQDQLDRLYEIQEKELNAQTEALEKEEDNAKLLRDKAIEDIKNGNEELFREMLEWNNQYGDGIEDTIKTAWENAYKALLEYKELYEETYRGINLSNATAYAPSSDKWATAPVSGIVAVESKDDTSGGGTDKSDRGKTILDDATKRKIAAAIWAGNYGWGNDPDRSKRLAEVFGSDNGIQALVNKGVGANDEPPGEAYTYLNMRKKILGYASGTKNALAGLHALDELGTETIFESKNGQRYKMFTGGEKVLNATASNFLYEFANNGMSVIEKAMKGMLEGAFREITGNSVYNEINLGDIIVQGNADRATVSEIRRAQRDALDTMLREMNKLSK